MVKLGWQVLFPQHVSRPTAGGGRSSCTWPALFVRALLQVSFPLFDRRAVQHVLRESTTASGIGHDGSFRGVHGCQDVLFEACEGQVHDTLGVTGRRAFHTLLLLHAVHKKDTQPRAGDFNFRDDPQWDSLHCLGRQASKRFTLYRHKPSRLACPSVTFGDASSNRAACGLQCLAASCDQANACLAIVIKVISDHERHVRQATAYGGLLFH